MRTRPFLLALVLSLLVLSSRAQSTPAEEAPPSSTSPSSPQPSLNTTQPDQNLTQPDQNAIQPAQNATCKEELRRLCPALEPPFTYERLRTLSCLGGEELSKVNARCRPHIREALHRLVDKPFVAGLKNISEVIQIIFEGGRTQTQEAMVSKSEMGSEVWAAPMVHDNVVEGNDDKQV